MDKTKTFEKWMKKYVKENDNIDYDLIILEDMLASWNASRIDTLIEIENLSNELEAQIGFEKGIDRIRDYIDTEIKKAQDD